MANTLTPFFFILLFQRGFNIVLLKDKMANNLFKIARLFQENIFCIPTLCQMIFKSNFNYIAIDTYGIPSSFCDVQFSIFPS